ncbi:hypothetical protein MHK_006301, partial [Candidatus Magnetomorum sp. HK-1]
MGANPNEVQEGSVNVTINVTNVESGLISTPDIWYQPYGKYPIKIELISKVEDEWIYTGNYIVDIFTGDGDASYQVRATDNIGQVSTTLQSIVYGNNVHEAPGFVINT